MVVVIIGVLAALIVPRLFKHVGTSKRKVAEGKITQLETQVELFQYTFERPISSLEDLVRQPSDVQDEQWSGYEPLKEKDLLDSWGRPFVFKRPGDHNTQSYDLYSLGADGEEGGEGDNADIGNW